jgi:hypothetical protein
VRAAGTHEIPTLLELASLRGGDADARAALEFALQWAVTRRALGRPPRLAEFAAWWGHSRSTAFRGQRRFRRSFPGERTPDRLLDLVAGAWDEREGLAGLAAVRVRSRQGTTRSGPPIIRPA